MPSNSFHEIAGSGTKDGYQTFPEEGTNQTVTEMSGQKFLMQSREDS